MRSENIYDQHFRAIGQSIEIKRISVFELKSEAGRYVVRGVPENHATLLSRFRQWRNRMQGASHETPISYGTGEIERLEMEGRSRRAKPDRLPDFYSLPNTLTTFNQPTESAIHLPPGRWN